MSHLHSAPPSTGNCAAIRRSDRDRVWTTLLGGRLAPSFCTIRPARFSDASRLCIEALQILRVLRTILPGSRGLDPLCSQ